MVNYTITIYVLAPAALTLELTVTTAADRMSDDPSARNRKGCSVRFRPDLGGRGGGYSTCSAPLLAIGSEVWPNSNSLHLAPAARSLRTCAHRMTDTCFGAVPDSDTHPTFAEALRDGVMRCCVLLQLHPALCRCAHLGARGCCPTPPVRAKGQI